MRDALDGNFRLPKPQLLSIARPQIVMEGRFGATPKSDKIEWTRVCDRGGDIYELSVSCQHLTE